MKCELCKQTIDVTFLSKPLGTVVKDNKGTKHWVCSNCQKGKQKVELLTQF